MLLQLTPLRSLKDFVLESARFQLPAFNDLEKWGNRVVKNLLYYQTNYFVLWAIIFAVIGLVHPGKIILGKFTIKRVFKMLYITRDFSFRYRNCFWGALWLTKVLWRRRRGLGTK